MRVRSVRRSLLLVGGAKYIAGGWFEGAMCDSDVCTHEIFGFTLCEFVDICCI